MSDILLDESEYSLIPSQTYKNNVAMIYMPRVETYLEYTSFMFNFQNITGWATNIEMNYYTVNNNIETSIYNATIDSSWWGNDTANELAEIDVETTLPIFNSLDLENPLNDVSIYSLLFDENNKMIYTEGTTSANTTIIDKYFKQEYFN